MSPEASGGEDWTRVMDAARPGDRLEEANARAQVKSQLFGGRAPPVMLSRYVLLQRIGSGALGAVYAAYDPELDRKVAIKLLHAWGRGGDKRILREARALAKVAHPNVIAVHDVGAYDETAGTAAGILSAGVFIVMELVDGCDLQQWLGVRKRSRAEILDVFLAAGRGLQAAHEAGLVHRDFKPGNVLVGTDGRVRVVDFGLARPGPRSDTGDPAPDFTEEVAGTPAYMAPEQHAGRAVGAAADQYAFCVSLFEALHGERPFVGKTTGQLWEAKRSGRPPEAIQASKAGVPRSLARALERGLDPDPTRRYASMPELLAVLERGRRRRWPWVLAGLAVVGGTAAILPSERPCDDAPRLRDEVWAAGLQQQLAERFAGEDASYAARSWSTVRAEVDAYLGRWVDERTRACEATMIDRTQPVAEMNRRLHCLDRGLDAVEALAGVLVEDADGPVERAVELVERLPSLDVCNLPPDVAVEEVDAAPVRRALARARALLVTGLLEEAAAEARRAVELAEATGDPRLRAEAHLLAGSMAFTRGSLDAGEVYAALAAAQKADADDLSAEALLSLAKIAIQKTRFEEARGLLAVAEGAAERTEVSPHVRLFVLGVHTELDLASGSLRAVESAKAYADEARRIHGADHTTVARAQAAEGFAAELAGDVEAYAERMKAAHETFERRLGPDHPTTAEALSGYASALSRLERHEEALAAFERAKAILTAAHGEGDNRVARIDLNAAFTLSAMGRDEDALASTRRALDRFRAVYGDVHPSVGLALSNLAGFELEAGRPERALQAASEAVEVLEASVGPDHHNTLFATIARARAEAALGRTDEARRAVERARVRIAKTLGDEHPDVSELDDFLAELGDPPP